MKKYLVLTIVICLLTAGCGKQNVPKAEKKAESIDVDLTAMSSTMIYAEVSHMMSNPDTYLGKTIKMSGPYTPSYYAATDFYYHYVVVEDAAACCQQGLEFIWNGDHAYPDDYPEEGTRIEVVGVFDSYEELGETYYYLSVDEIKENPA